MDPSRLIRHRVLSHPWYLVKGCQDCSSCHRHSCSLSPWVSRAAFALRLDGMCMYGRECVQAQARCTSNTAYSKIQEYKQLNSSKLGAASKEAVSLHISQHFIQLWNKMNLISLWSGRTFFMNLWSGGHCVRGWWACWRVLCCTLCFLSKEAFRRTWGKSAADVCTGTWLMLLPFGLGKHWLYHNTLHTMTVYLLRSRCPKC